MTTPEATHRIRRGRWRGRARVAHAIALTLALTGCKHKGPLPVCIAETASPVNPDASARALDPEAWFGAMLRSYDWGRGLPGAPMTDCLRRELRWRAAPAECPVPPRFIESETPLPARPLQEQDLVVMPGPEDMLIVWVMARRFTDGDALGPIALVRWTRRGVELMAIGTLRAGSRSPNLWIEPISRPPRAASAEHRAPEPTSLLVVESERCAVDDPERCFPGVQLLPIFGGFIRSLPLVHDERCLGPARFDRRRIETVELAQGWQRQFTLSGELRFSRRDIEVIEQVSVTDFDGDPTRDALDDPGHGFRTVDDRYTIRLEERRFVVSRPSLWERVLLEDARVNATDEPAESR